MAEIVEYLQERLEQAKSTIEKSEEEVKYKREVMTNRIQHIEEQCRKETAELLQKQQEEFEALQEKFLKRAEYEIKSVHRFTESQERCKAKLLKMIEGLEKLLKLAEGYKKD